MEVTLHDATDRDLAIARNLVPYYIYDMSEHLGWACTADGRFDGCDELPSYWAEPGKHAFMLRAGQEIAGFALVRGNHEEEDVDYSIGEFFVLRKFRGRRAAERIARQLFDRFPGRWEVQQLARNAPALAFWRKVIARYTDHRFNEHVRESPWGEMNVIRFQNDGSSPSAVEGPLFQKIDCLMLNVADLDAALSFYRDRLGLPLAWRTETAVAFRVGEAELVLNQGEPTEPETDIMVASAEGAARRFVEAGGSVVTGPFEIKIGHCVVVADPWGNKLVLLDSTKGLLKTDADGFVID